MKTKDLDSAIALAEGGKSQASIGDVRQIRKIIDQLIINDVEVRDRYVALVRKGMNKSVKALRAKKA